MPDLVMHAGLFLAALVGMEGAAWILHRYVMHGPLWIWHRSHHQPHEGFLERNDLFAVIFSAPAIVAIFFGLRDVPWLLPVGLGISAYGLAYFFVHDIVVHRRLKLFPAPRSGLIGHLHEAHMLHHAVHEKHGAVSYGFLYAPSTDHLRTLMARRRGAVTREEGP